MRGPSMRYQLPVGWAATPSTFGQAMLPLTVAVQG